MSQKNAAFEQYGFTSSNGRGNQPIPGFIRYWEIGEYAELMHQLLSFLDAVLETEQVPFDVRHQVGRQQAVRNPVGVSGYRSLAGFLPLCGQWMDLYWPAYAYSVDLQLFFDCFMQHPLARMLGCGVRDGIADKSMAASLYNDFVGTLRMEAVRRGVRKWLSDWRGNLDDQERAIRRYLGALSEQYRCLVPVRVDLYYADYATADASAMARTGWAASENGVWVPMPSNVAIGHGRPETRARIDAAVAIQDRDRFFENRRGADRLLFDRMVGYIWKLEQGGRHCANHFHCIFFLDPAKLTQAELCQLKCLIGDRWRRVTRGQGLMYDCHARLDREALRARGQWAVDPIASADPMQLATLANYVVRYFAKDDDQMVRAKPTARARTLTMGR